MVYFLYGLGLTAVLWLFVHDNPGALLQADFILWWLIVSGFLLACCSKLPCRLCGLIPGSLGASCRSLSCPTDYHTEPEDSYHAEPEGKPAP